MGVLINPKTAAARGIADGDIIRITSPYGNILGIAKVTEGVHLDCLAISNALTRWTGYHSIVKAGGGNFNRLLPANLKNTDANSGQMECTAKVKVSLFRKKPMSSKDAEQTLRKHTFSK
jgi:anaerobic selenocysteine-containing dehydrogenase